MFQLAFLRMPLAELVPVVRLLAFQIDETVGAGGGSSATLILVAGLGLGVFGLVALLRIAYDTPIHLILIPGDLICTVLLAFVGEEPTAAGRAHRAARRPPG